MSDRIIAEFNGFMQGVVGKKLPSDTTLNNMKKSELIELLHIAQHNYDTLMQYYINAVNANIKKIEEYNKEIRDKVLDEFVDRLKIEATQFKHIEDDYYGFISDMAIERIAEQMKEVTE